MKTNDTLKFMSDLIKLTESRITDDPKHRGVKHFGLVEAHLGGDSSQPSREEAARTGLGRLALAMEPELNASSETVSEDSTTPSASLKQDVALSMAKGGYPAPAGAVPSENNPAYMGTQDPNAVVKEKSLYAKGGSTLGMNLPADQRGHSADMSGKYMGLAPDGPDLRTIADPELRKLYTEALGGFPQALEALVKGLNLGIMEADKILGNDSFGLDAAIRAKMVSELKALGYKESVVNEWTNKVSSWLGESKDEKKVWKLGKK